MPQVNFSENQGGADFAPCPIGDFQAVVCDVVDEGWIEVIDKKTGESKGLRPHVTLVYQMIADEEGEAMAREDGKPWLVYGWKTNLSLYETANFYKDACAIMGKEKVKEAVAAKTFNTDDLLGLNVNVLVSHNTSAKGKVYANIQPLKPWPRRKEWKEARDYTERHKTEKWQPPIHSAFGPGPDDDAGTPAPQPKPSVRPESNPPVVPTEGELGITHGQLSRIPSIARQKFGDEYGGDLAELVFDSYGKKQKFLSKDEGDDLIAKLLLLPDFIDEPDPFADLDDEGATSDEIASDARLMAVPASSAPRNAKSKAASEAYS